MPALEPGVQRAYFDDAREASHPAGKHQREHDETFDLDARIAGDAGARADGAQPEAQRGRPQQQVDHRDHDQRDQRADVDTRPEDDRQVGSGDELRALGQVPAWLLERAARHVLHEEDRDVVEHQRADDLANAALDLQPGRQRGPERAADNAGEQHTDDEGGPGPLVAHRQRHRAARQRAHEILPLAADIPDARPERRGEAQTHQEQRRRLQDRLFDLSLSAECAAASWPRTPRSGSRRPEESAVRRSAGRPPRRAAARRS